jgi:hypothetical protein
VWCGGHGGRFSALSICDFSMSVTMSA